MNEIEMYEFEEKVRLVNIDINLQMSRFTKDVYCPFCGASSGDVKNNGEGYYRCKGKERENPCGVFFLAREEQGK